MKKWLLLAVVAGLLIVGGGAWLGYNNWYQSSLEPLTTEPIGISFEIESGTSSADVADQLEANELIQSASAMRLYLRKNGIESLQAGLYRLSSHYSTQEIVRILAAGEVDTRFVTIPPGLRIDQIEKALINEGFSEEEVKAALTKRYDHPLFEDLPEGASLEGYIYPETIQVTSQTTVEQLLERHFDAFYNNLSEATLAGIRQQGLSFHEGVILASIVQREMSDPLVQPQIAQVFLKRLAEDISLGADATFYYAAAISGREPSVDIDSPYNTRQVAGLTPGPIANFNLSALEAVAQPATTDYLYFVSGDDGVTYFAKTQAEHEANTREHCFENCQIQPL